MAAPEGNQNEVKGKRWMRAIDKALSKRSKAAGIEELDRLAEKYLDEAEAKGFDGLETLANRIDGKPAQQLNLAGHDGSELVVRFENADERA